MARMLDYDNRGILEVRVLSETNPLSSGAEVVFRSEHFPCSQLCCWPQ
jgi:hypothetical protein